MSVESRSQSLSLVCRKFLSVSVCTMSQEENILPQNTRTLFLTLCILDTNQFDSVHQDKQGGCLYLCLSPETETA